MGLTEALVWLTLSICLGSVVGTTPDGLFISNSTHILFSRGGTQQPESWYKQDNGRIVGLAVDHHMGLLFWSDVGYFTKGIYKAEISEVGHLFHIERMLSTEVSEVNGISVDYSAQHVYFTDGRRGTVEVMDYQGRLRRTLTSSHSIPRGVTADPRNGYLFWNDQGSMKIERSRLDGSDRETIVETDVQWPNQMVMHYPSNRLMWVDAKSKKLMSCAISGLNVEEKADLSSETGANAIFGVTLSGNMAFISVWNSNKVLSVDLSSGDVHVKFFDVGSDVLFSMAYNAQQEQPKPTERNGCTGGHDGGCSYLCLPTTGSGHRCSCPSYGGITLAADGTSCSKPSQILLYTSADQGEVGYVDLARPNHRDKYLVARSMRPVAVAFDPIHQKVYWSDVMERSIHVASLDGTGHRVFLASNSSLGIVDGMAVDVKGRKLYFSNMDMVAINSVTYSWHKIEAIGLDGEGRRTVVETAEKPRGLYIDQENRALYYTDWGSQAAVFRVNMDGSAPQLLIFPGLQNPNSVVVRNGVVSVVDSFYKSRKPENRDTFLPQKNGTMIQLAGGRITELSLDLQTPFGLAQHGDEFFISDWESNSILKYNTGSGEKSVLVAGVKGPMAMLVAEVDDELQAVSECEDAECEDICFELSSSRTTCACDSYDAHVLTQNQQTCAVPADSLFIADLSSLHVRSLGGADGSTYNLVHGNSFSNIVSLTLDEEKKAVYFSDVNRRNIYKVTIATGRTELFLETDAVVDGLTMDAAGNRLFWTDYDGGSISVVNVRTKVPQVLVQGLDKPRAIVLDERNNYMYWTEWGERPRVARTSLSAVAVSTVIDSPLVTRPNGLHLDLDNNMMYVGESGGEKTYIMRCSLNANGDCEVLPYTVNVPRHVYSVRKVGMALYYTDWVAGELAMIDMQTGHKTSVVEDLMRPTEFMFSAEPALTCPADHGCSSTCLPHLSGYTCTCPPGQVLQADGATCAASTTGEWIAAPEACSTPCAEGTVCARRVGSVEYECACQPGYRMEDDVCVECEEDSYQAYLSTVTTCTACPAQTSAPGRGATQCKCSSSLVWDHHTHTCQGTKPGTCPRVPIHSAVSCDGTRCEQDADCPRAQRCCPDDVCSESRCRDPVNLWECVYEGRLYAVGVVFHPEPCVRCSCDADRSYASSLYGGATCKITNCKKLQCAASEQVLLAGACCPVCGGTEQPIRITNCPQEAQQYTLPADADMVRIDFGLEYRDTLGREMTVRQTPVDRYLPWIGNGQEQSVQVEALAQRADGGWDSDVCNITVIINDEMEPSVVCPSDVQLISADLGTEVRWTPAQYEDNVCGRSECAVSSVPEEGSTFATGVTTVQYTVQDAGGNTGKCSFDVTIDAPTSPTCVPPMIYDGYLSCVGVQEGSSAQVCDVVCSDDYEVHRTTQLQCDGDIWSPEITPQFQHFACIKKVPRHVMGKVTVEGAVCPSASLDSFSMFVEENIKSSLSTGKQEKVKVSVTLKGCESKRQRRQVLEEDRSLTIEIVLEAEEGVVPVAAMEDVISDIEGASESCELWLREDMKCGEVEVSSTMPVSGCQPGQEAIEDFCLECPVGTHESSGKCKLCAEDHYQGVEGQTTCEKCPTEQHSPKGSVFQSDCVTTAKSFMVGYIIAIVVAFLLAIVLCAVCVVWCCRRKHHNQKMGGPATYNNSAYDAEVAQTHGSRPEKKYESLEQKKLGENEYMDIK